MVMQVISENIALWQATAGESYNRRAVNYPGFLSEEQKAKLERIRQGRMLYDGQHREYFLGETRTQFNFPEMRAGSSVIRPYIKLNILKLVCNKTADLLFGEEPLLRVEDDIQQAKLGELV